MRLKVHTFIYRNFRAILAICFTLFFIITGCHHGRCAEKPVNIVASTFPLYIFAQNICEGASNINLQLLIPSQAGCPHDFSLRPADMQKLAKADILIINGHGLEEFLAKPLSGLAHRPALIDAGQNVPVLEEFHESDHEHVNSHIFAAPAEAALMAANIVRGLKDFNSENAGIYEKNAQNYITQLNGLSQKFKAVGQKATNKGIIIEHSALAYMAQNAGLTIIASLEGNASASQLAAAKKILQKEKPALLAGDVQFPDRLLATLAEETGIPFARLNPCAAGPEDAGPGYYIEAMKQNLKLLERYFD